MFISLVVVSVVLFFIVLFIWATYNDFIIKRNQVKTDLSDVLVQVKRKADLIERLASVVEGYAKHEEETFENVAKARSSLDTSRSVKDTAQAENMFTQTMRSLFMVVESNPKLKANENYMNLQQELKETEDNIARYREEYNRSVQEYNNTIQTFPNLLSAALFQFKEEELFEA